MTTTAKTHRFSLEITDEELAARAALERAFADDYLALLEKYRAEAEAIGGPFRAPGIKSTMNKTLAAFRV